MDFIINRRAGFTTGAFHAVHQAALYSGCAGRAGRRSAGVRGGVVGDVRGVGGILGRQRLKPMTPN